MSKYKLNSIDVSIECPHCNETTNYDFQYTGHYKISCLVCCNKFSFYLDIDLDDIQKSPTPEGEKEG